MYRQNSNRNCEQPNQWEGQHMQRMYPHSSAHCQPWHRDQAPWVQGSSSQNTSSQSARQRGGVQGSYSQNTPYHVHYQNVCDTEQVQGLYSPNTHTQGSYSHDNTTFQQARHREQVRGSSCSYSQNNPYQRAWDREPEQPGSYPQNTTSYQQPLRKEQIQRVYSENTAYQQPWQGPGDQQIHGVKQYPHNTCTEQYPYNTCTTYNDQEKVQEKGWYPQSTYNDDTLHAEGPYPQTTHPNTSSVSAILYHHKNTPGSQAHQYPESSTWNMLNEENKDLVKIELAEGNYCGIGAVTAQVTNNTSSSNDEADKSDHAILNKEGPQNGQKKKFRCVFCPKKHFKKQSHLKNHMQDVHEEEKPVQKSNCNRCDRPFINNKALKRHTRLCSKIKCKICGKLFRRDKMATYRYHMAAHNGSAKDAPDQGTVSGIVEPSLATSVNSSVKKDVSKYQHLTHVTAKEYIDKCTCPICQKVCKSINKMKRHLSKHLKTQKQSKILLQCQEGESKHLICKLCGMEFPKFCRFQRHLRKQHKFFGSSATSENVQNLETHAIERIVTLVPVQPTEFDHEIMEMEQEQSASEPTLDDVFMLSIKK